ncbi:hypothetical protein INT47_009007 [Mucor saturninus]|uniref:Uncharacterized protein n=1 Tax=Mucor saturninus TaxID=64648 RepID=A0A8H7QUB4_9FUNG|nr:hypothetical protein INT47_009007 [Mucor saturninus]
MPPIVKSGSPLTLSMIVNTTPTHGLISPAIQGLSPYILQNSSELAGVQAVDSKFEI